jgi:hypothetical protein
MYADQRTSNFVCNVSLFCDSSDVEYLSEVGRDTDAVWAPPTVITPPAFKRKSTWQDYVDPDSITDVIADAQYSRIAAMTFDDVVAYVRRRLAHHGMNVGEEENNNED